MDFINIVLVCYFYFMVHGGAFQSFCYLESFCGVWLLFTILWILYICYMRDSEQILAILGFLVGQGKAGVRESRKVKKDVQGVVNL